MFARSKTEKQESKTFLLPRKLPFILTALVTCCVLLFAARPEATDFSSFPPSVKSQLAKQFQGPAVRKTVVLPDAITTGQRYLEVLSGRRQLSIAIVVLSCTTDACAQDRARMRDTLFTPFYVKMATAGDESLGITYCPNPGAQQSAFTGSDGRIPWKTLRRRVMIRHIFAVGYDGVASSSSTASRLLNEREEFNDVVAAPGSDGADSIVQRVPQVIGAVGEHTRQATSYSQKKNCSRAEDLQTLPFDYSFDADFVLKLDTDSFARLPHIAVALFELLGETIAVANASAIYRNIPVFAPELYFGRFLTDSSDSPLFAMGAGYAVSRGLAISIAHRIRRYDDQSSSGPVQITDPYNLAVWLDGAVEDLALAELLRTYPHAKVSDRRIHQVESWGGGTSHQPSCKSLIVHSAKTKEQWTALAAYFTEGEKGAFTSCACAPLVRGA